MKKALLISLCVAGGTFCQTTMIDLSHQTRNAPFPQYSVGSGTPAGNCVAGRDFYMDSASQESWVCAASNTWKKVLSSSNSGPMLMKGQNGVAPAAPAAGSTALYFDLTAKLGQTKDDTGNIATMVRPIDCSTSGGFAQRINTDGTVTCATAATGGTSGAGFAFSANQGAAVTLDGTDKTIWSVTVPPIPDGKCIMLRFGLAHTTGSGGIVYKLFYGSDSQTIFGGTSVFGPIVVENVSLCNNAGTHLAQQLTFPPYVYSSSGGYVSGNIVYPNGDPSQYIAMFGQDASAAHTLKVTANASSADRITLYNAMVWSFGW